MRYFLSYSRSDQAFALRFAHDLAQAGVDVWVDQSNIRIGQNWDRAVEAAVRSCEGFIVILSPRSVSSENVADEVSVAIGEGKQIIPVLFEPCTVPMRLARLQSIDATSDYRVALRRCMDILPDRGADVPGGQADHATMDVVSEPDHTLVHWRHEVLEEAEKKLLTFVGPVARQLVHHAARSARSKVELYQQLSLAIPEQAQRLAFVGGAQPPSAQPPLHQDECSPVAGGACVLTPEQVSRLSETLTGYLGPVARHVLLSEARVATSHEDLFARLGARISNDEERAELLTKIRS